MMPITDDHQKMLIVTVNTQFALTMQEYFEMKCFQHKSRKVLNKFRVEEFIYIFPSLVNFVSLYLHPCSL